MTDERNRSSMNEALYSLQMVLTPAPSSMQYPPFMMLKVQKGVYLPPLWCRNQPHPFPSLFHWFGLVSGLFPMEYVEFCVSYGLTFVEKNEEVLKEYMNVKLIARWQREHGAESIDTVKEDMVAVPTLGEGASNVRPPSRLVKDRPPSTVRSAPQNNPGKSSLRPPPAIHAEHFDTFEHSGSESDEDSYNWRYQGRPETAQKYHNEKSREKEGMGFQAMFDTPREMNNGGSSTSNGNNKKNSSKSNNSSNSNSNSMNGNNSHSDPSHVYAQNHNIYTTNNLFIDSKGNKPAKPVKPAKTPQYRQYDAMKQQFKAPSPTSMPQEFTLYSQGLGQKSAKTPKPRDPPPQRFFADNSVFGTQQQQQQQGSNKNQDAFFKRGKVDSVNGLFTFGGVPRMRPCSANSSKQQENMRKPDGNSSSSSGSNNQPSNSSNSTTAAALCRCLSKAATTLQAPTSLQQQAHTLTPSASARDFKLVYLDLLKLCHPDKVANREDVYDSQRLAYTAFRAG